MKRILANLLFIVLSVPVLFAQPENIKDIINNRLSDYKLPFYGLRENVGEKGKTSGVHNYDKKNSRSLISECPVDNLE